MQLSPTIRLRLSIAVESYSYVGIPVYYARDQMKGFLVLYQR